jgi:cytoskeletal protein RodZ
MLRVSLGVLPGIPSPHVVRFTVDGEILVEGPVAAGRSVDRAARLLDTMLPGFDAPPEFRASGALRLVMARAAGTLDVPAYRTLDAFAAALERFSAPDPTEVIRTLGASWAAAVDLAERETPAADEEPAADETITVSDLRRARRTTGLSLREIAERTRIPISLLRELEWGYFANWPSGHYARTQLVRYARAAGLDDQVVIRAVLPEFAAVGRHLDTSQSEDRAAEAVITSLVAVPAGRALQPVEDERRRRPSRWLAALAIPALVAIGLVPAMWNEAAEEAPIEETAQASAPASEPARGSVSGDPTPPSGDTVAPAVNPAPSRDAAEPVRALRGGRNGDAPVAKNARPSLPAENLEARPAGLRGNPAFSPTFASVGSAMFYHAQSDGRSALMRADTDGEGAVLRITRVVDDNAQNFHARPSPDGSQIAFDSDRDGERAVYIADATGRNVRRVTGQGFAAVPSWSPDGKHLTYVRAEDWDPRVWNLWLLDLETGETKRLTSHKVGQPWGAAWFPDGEHIAYSHETRLVVRPISGGAQQIYPSPRKGRELRTPAVSPDGRQVIFQVRGDGAWLLDLTDGSMRRILSDPKAEEFTWSPDGRQVAYHSRQSGKWGVWIMAPR